MGIKSKNKRIPASFFRGKLFQRNKTKNTFLTKRPYSPIIIKISLKGSSSSIAGSGREEQDKEQPIAVAKLSIT